MLEEFEARSQVVEVEPPNIKLRAIWNHKRTSTPDALTQSREYPYHVPEKVGGRRSTKAAMPSLASFE